MPYNTIGFLLDCMAFRSLTAPLGKEVSKDGRSQNAPPRTRTTPLLPAKRRLRAVKFRGFQEARGRPKIHMQKLRPCRCKRQKPLCTREIVVEVRKGHPLRNSFELRDYGLIRGLLTQKKVWRNPHTCSGRSFYVCQPYPYSPCMLQTNRLPSGYAIRISLFPREAGTGFVNPLGRKRCH